MVGWMIRGTVRCMCSVCGVEEVYTLREREREREKGRDATNVITKRLFDVRFYLFEQLRSIEPAMMLV